MAKLKVDGRELRLVTPDTAKTRDVMALQDESGMKLQELRERSQDNETFAILITSFLTQRNAGIFKSWDELLEGDFTALGELVAEPGDEARIPGAEGEESLDPPYAPTSAEAAAATPAASAPSETA